MINWWTSRSSNPVLDRKKVEPGATFSLLENHWKQAMDVMNSSGREDSGSSSEAALTVISHLNQMISFLRHAQAEDSTEKECKEFWIRNRCSDTVIKWLHSLQIKGMELIYEEELKLVQTLKELCLIATKDEELLGYMKNEKDCTVDSWDGAYSLSSLLLEYSLKSDPRLGEPARNSFIQLVRIASKFPGLEKSFSEESGLGLTNVVISGLSACFAQLTTFVPATNEELSPFETQLRFVDSITFAAPPKVSATIADCFSNVFLNAVILPALTQDEGNRSLHSKDDPFSTSIHEEIATVTNYLKIVCDNLTHPLLIKSLITFVNSQLLPTLVHRMAHANTALIVSTLGLLSRLLEFYCEDFWFELVLKHLMSQNHLMVSQRGLRLPYVDFEEASVRFLSLIPSVVLECIGPEAMKLHYTQYLNNELNRWSDVDELAFSLNPPLWSSSAYAGCSTSNLNSNLSSTNTGGNPVFPTWKFKYDGTDSLDLNYNRNTYAAPIQNHGCIEEPSSSSIPYLKPEEDSVKLHERSEGLPTEQPPPVFTTINLQQQNSEEHHSIGSAEPLTPYESDSIGFDGRSNPRSDAFVERNAAHSDGYGSLDSLGGSGSESPPSAFGPFLDILLNHMKNLSSTPPEVILMVSEIISTLAASRIPIITSILLDPSLVLQPSLLSFPMLLNRIRVDFDQSLKSAQPLLKEVWKELYAANNSYNSGFDQSPRTSLVTSISSTFDAALSSAEQSFTDNLRKRMSTSGSFTSALNQVFRKSSGESTTTIAGLNDSVQSVGSQSYKYVSKSPVAASASNPSTSESLKVMATRAIYFSHWLLELGAIAQQQCWTRPVL